MAQRDRAVVLAIKAASRRMLNGTPEVVEVGRLSVSALADEARVSRNRLNREYQQEADEHVLAVKAAQDPGEPTTVLERELMAQVAALTDRVSTLEDQRTELSQSKDSWKTAAEHFIRLAHLKQVEVNRLTDKDEVSKNARARLRRELDDAVARAEQAEYELLKREASTGSESTVRNLRPVTPSEDE